MGNNKYQNQKTAAATSTSAPEPTQAPTQAPTAEPTQEPTQAPVDTSTEQATAEGAGVKSQETELLAKPVEPVVEAPALVAATPKAIVVEATKPVADNEATVDQLGVILKNVPEAYQVDINRIVMYIGRMSPLRPVDQKMGISEQVALYRSIQNIINRQEEYFTPLFSALLYLFKVEATGALGDRYRMRFMENVTMHAGDRKAFANLTQMLHILADPKSRAVAMNQVNMEMALENGLTADGRTRVLQYFEV